MKFAQYLESTQTPEWKRAYIDYKLLKKLVARAREKWIESHGEVPDRRPGRTRSLRSAPASGSIVQPAPPPRGTPRGTPGQVASGSGAVNPPGSVSTNYGSIGHSPPLERGTGASITSYNDVNSPSALHLPPPIQELPPATDNATLPEAILQRRKSLKRSATDSVALPSSPHYERHFGFPRRITGRAGLSRVNEGPESAPAAHGSPSSWHGVLKLLRKASMARMATPGEPPSPYINLASLSVDLSAEEALFFKQLDREAVKVDSFYKERSKEAHSRLDEILEQIKELDEHKRLLRETGRTGTWNFSNVLGATGVRAIVPNGHHTIVSRRGPEEYKEAKKALKKALLEYYRGLELLKNYRIINLEGFRKILKKFDKNLKHTTQELYIREKAELQDLANGDDANDLIKRTEELFYKRFEGGDRKKALEKLRVDNRERPHHLSTFRTGLLLGLAIPAFVVGLYKALQPSTHEDLPQWTALLQIYGIFFIPVLYALSVGVNMQAWRAARVNWIFIFELNLRTAIDPSQYFETPAILLSTLVYAFFLSFTRLTIGHLHPNYIPMIWLGFAITIMLDPLPVNFKASRYWLLQQLSALIRSASMFYRIEFTDFWLGDQFCTLAYSTGSLYFVGCAYRTSFRDPWSDCGIKPRNWIGLWLLASTPNIIRLLQSLRRFYDSSQTRHLVNGGKYASGIVALFAYTGWRAFGMPTSWYIAFCFFSTVQSIYTSGWDILIDWSFMERNDKHPLLRATILYENWIPMYYFAIVSNVVVRFIWVLYAVKPMHAPSMAIRSFIAGMLEFLRRWQWNFFRLENEHLGNMDQYRVTREMPLPYRVGDHEEGASDDEADMEQLSKQPTMEAVGVSMPPEAPSPRQQTA